jgi:hypothetical protein
MSSFLRTKLNQNPSFLLTASDWTNRSLYPLPIGRRLGRDGGLAPAAQWQGDCPATTGRNNEREVKG